MLNTEELKKLLDDYHYSPIEKSVFLPDHNLAALLARLVGGLGDGIDSTCMPKVLYGGRFYIYVYGSPDYARIFFGDILGFDRSAECFTDAFSMSMTMLAAIHLNQWVTDRLCDFSETGVDRMELFMIRLNRAVSALNRQPERVRVVFDQMIKYAIRHKERDHVYGALVVLEAIGAIDHDELFAIHRVLHLLDFNGTEFINNWEEMK